MCTGLIASSPKPALPTGSACPLSLAPAESSSDVRCRTWKTQCHLSSSSLRQHQLLRAQSHSSAPPPLPQVICVPKNGPLPAKRRQEMRRAPGSHCETRCCTPNSDDTCQVLAKNGCYVIQSGGHLSFVEPHHNVSIKEKQSITMNSP